LRTKYEHIGIHLSLIDNLSVARLVGNLQFGLISYARELEVLRDLTVFEASSNFIFELSQFLLHPRVDISAFIVYDKVFSPINRPNNEAFLVERLP
jgi:hypothetical protein